MSSRDRRDEMRFWRIGKRNADLDRELRADRDLEEEEQREHGLSAEEARLAARRAFGNLELIRDQAHEAWGLAPFERLFQDIRLALRQLGRSPGFSAAAIATLGLGIGATTAMFSLVNAVLLRPLPFPEPDRLMWMAARDHSLRGDAPNPISYPDYFDWRDQNHTFNGIASYTGGATTLELKGQAERLEMQTVSGNFFQVLGVAPMLGRDFGRGDEQSGHRTVMLSYALWQSRFGGARDIAGKSITLDGRSYTVAGVMPRGFQFPLEKPGPALWISIAEDVQGKKTGERGFDVLRIVGRLKTGVRVEQAREDLSAVAANLAREYPGTNSLLDAALVKPELEHLVGDTRPAMRVLSGAVALVLLIVCANVAGLLLARGSSRHAEFAVRSALGAGRAAIIRQLLVESATLSLGGGVAGVALAWGLLHAAIGLMPHDVARVGEATIDGAVLLFDLALSLATGVLFGLLPAWRLSGTAPVNAMRSGTRTVAGARGRNRLLSGLVVLQTAIGLVLLAASGLLIKSFIRILNVDPGFDPRRVIAVGAGVSFKQLSRDQHLEFFEQAVERLRSLPGVQSASAGWPLPMSGAAIMISFNIVGQPVARGDEPSEVLGVAMPGYFESMRIPLIVGRTFGTQDSVKGAPTIIVNQAFAAKYFREQSPLGQHIQVRMGDGNFEQPVREVVGVVGNTRERSLTVTAEPQYYLPYAQAVVRNPFLLVRTFGNPDLLQGAVRAAIQSLDRSVPVYQVSTLGAYVSTSADGPRFQMFVLAGFAGLALLLVAVGLYGLLSYTVTQRSPEIGVRIALGARRADVLGMMLARGLALTVIGVLAGVGISGGVMRLMTGMLFGVRPFDPFMFGATAVVLLLAGTAASLAPASRAARLNPLDTLREQ